MRACSSTSLMVASDKLASANEETPPTSTRSQAELVSSERRKLPIARLVCKCCCQHLECIESALKGNYQVEPSVEMEAQQALDKTNGWSQTDAIDTEALKATEQGYIEAATTSSGWATRTEESQHMKEEPRND